jgi:hypothetical protein
MYRRPPNPSSCLWDDGFSSASSDAFNLRLLFEARPSSFDLSRRKVPVVEDGNRDEGRLALDEFDAIGPPPRTLGVVSTLFENPHEPRIETDALTQYLVLATDYLANHGDKAAELHECHE